VERDVAELGDVMLSVIVIVNAPTAVGSSALLDRNLLNNLNCIYQISNQSIIGDDLTQSLKIRDAELVLVISEEYNTASRNGDDKVCCVLVSCRKRRNAVSHPP
jgi:hypothetical protein